ncbi:MAG: winged helix-turn-helix domain-containing protein [Dehalococcoidia bacterium]|nr:winged helix-turn-helix domain-containing protein [Dehalococcoidia bacterium]MBK7127054.1 winged helix-turn-helix domain-containing protein [Dehalococcoidia bacterium]MBK7327547.1 winged helix-turn-helix domain-containing protein [Dehalococcoidia bacterium]MBK8558424.1 winged helix-turn-helix domain-containing protein [Dehalococcoidia bacterium]MBK9547357.1 winged helix-turn-helix domain-containing protein [Dehalococcoidia bacterium]
MPTVLAIVSGAPRALEGRSLMGDQLTVEIAAEAGPWIARAGEDVFDLLVLCGMSVDDQQAIVNGFHANRRWRLVPVLYVANDDSPGLAIPGTFRPEIDGIARGRLETPQVQKRIVELARDGIGSAELVVAGPFELDPLRGKLRLADLEVTLTEREAEILAILLAQPNRTVSSTEIIERGWGTEADARYLQILRRHVSNIRRKLQRTAAARSVRTVRGSGYRFDVKLAG